VAIQLLLAYARRLFFQALGAQFRLYSLAGFQKVAEKPGRMWGVEVIEEKYELGLEWDAADAESP
jgi:hypothetical protein